MQNDPMPYDGDRSSDKEERLQDFFARHGGESNPARRSEEEHDHRSGWYEVCAADGYTLRCDWSSGSESSSQMKFSEIRPILE
jgi:hypothetical protein